MTSKLSRFLHLERARTDRTEEETASPVQSGGRFEAPDEQRKAPHEAAVPEAHLERFKAQAPLALADVPEGDRRRFPRCLRCESENGRFAQACAVCGADLHTPEQREFNERLWQERKKGLSRTREDEAEALRQFDAQRPQKPSGAEEAEAGTQREAEALRQFEAPRYLPPGGPETGAPGPSGLPDAQPERPGRTRYAADGALRREEAEELARQLAQLREEEGTHPWIRAFAHHSTVGTALLSLINPPLARLATVVVLIALPLGLWRFGTGLWQLGGVVLGFFLFGLFIPPRAFKRY
jgi:hypothetical protein